jgi:hydrogenase large subunit
MATHEVDPISRIEGHLGVKLTVNDTTGRVTGADVHGNLWRGFENFLIGREPNDAITFVQRICGVCPVPHGMTSTYAVDAALGYSDNMQTFSDIDGDGKGVPAKAVHIRNLVLSAEFLMSSITHFYHLAAPSYVQGPNIPPWTPYFDDSYYHPYLRSAGQGTADLTGAGQAQYGNAGSTMPSLAADGFSSSVWSAVIRSYVKALRIRRLTFEASALFAGRARWSPRMSPVASPTTPTAATSRRAATSSRR